MADNEIREAVKSWAVGEPNHGADEIRRVPAGPAGLEARFWGHTFAGAKESRRDRIPLKYFAVETGAGEQPLFAIFFSGRNGASRPNTTQPTDMLLTFGDDSACQV